MFPIKNILYFLNYPSRISSTSSYYLLRKTSTYINCLSKEYDYMSLKSNNPSTERSDTMNVRLERELCNSVRSGNLKLININIGSKQQIIIKSVGNKAP